MSEKQYEFFIPGRLPGLNEYTSANRTNCHKGAKMKKETELFIIYAIKNQLKQLVIHKPVFISYTWVEINKRRDLDNICFARKFIQDSLVYCGVLDNDGWKNITGFEDDFIIDKLRPGVLVRLKEIV